MLQRRHIATTVILEDPTRDFWETFYIYLGFELGEGLINNHGATIADLDFPRDILSENYVLCCGQLPLQQAL